MILQFVLFAFRTCCDWIGLYLLQCHLKAVLLCDRQFAHCLPATLQLIHLLLQPVGIAGAAPGQVPDGALQGPDATRSLPQLLLEGLSTTSKVGIML